MELFFLSEHLRSMSRAFVKETDNVDMLPDREVSPHPNYVTPRGLKFIDEEVDRL